MQFNFFKYFCSKSVLFSENQWKYQKVTKSKIKWSQAFYREVGSVMLRKHGKSFGQNPRERLSQWSLILRD